MSRMIDGDPIPISTEQKMTLSSSQMPGIDKFVDIIYGPNYAQPIGAVLDVRELIKNLHDKISTAVVFFQTEISDIMPADQAEALGIEVIDDVIEWLEERGDDQSFLAQIVIESAQQITSTTDIDSDIEVTEYPYVDTAKMARFAEILGLNDDQIPSSPEDLLDIMKMLTEATKPLDEIIYLNAQYLINSRVIPESMMISSSDDVLVQPTGSNDCVAYAAYHIARAAGKNDPIDFFLSNTRKAGFTQASYRNFDVNPAMDRLNIKLDTDTGASPMELIIKTLNEKKGAYLLNLGTDHAVAVVGIRRQRNGHIEFLVANSLPSYEIDGVIEDLGNGKLVWARAINLIGHAVRNIPVGRDPRENTIFYHWD